MKALILSVKAGYGHHSTGQAVIAELEERGFECVMLDTFEYVNARLAESISGGYLFSTKYFPETYGRAYGTLDKREERYDRHSLVSILAKVVSHRLKDFFEDYTPDIVIGTHSYACLLMTYMREKNIISCPTFGIVTDFTVHPFWESTALDYYVTPDALLNRQMGKKGIPEEKILPFGIPIKKKFANRMAQGDARKILGIPEGTTILVMMGSMGYGNMMEHIKLIDTIQGNFQILCVCGNNKKAKKEIDAYISEKTIYSYGFVDNIDTMMDASDCIITKPGGLTVSELLAKGLPAVILDPIPGQEERNMHFLVNNGAAVMVTDTFPIDEALYQLLKYPWRLGLLAESVKYLGKPDSTERLGDFIEELLEKNKREIVTKFA